MVTSTKPALAGTDFATWIASLPVSWTPQQTEIVGRAHRAARSALPSGIRNLEIADLLADLRMDHESISAALLHEAVNTGKLPLARVREEFGAAIADLVEGVDRLSLIGELHQHRIHKSEQLESLRKMLLAMAKDARVVLISLGSQLCKIRNIDLLPESQRQRLAHETVDVFAPLANRLGIGQFKWEMEDRALRCLDPHTYKTLAKALDERRSDRERYISEVMGLLKRELEKAGVRAEVTGRAKHLYSIWRKMQRKHVPFEQIFDVHAVRILVASVTDCYAALGTVHALWKNIPQEFDDYVAHPKDNGYQSLHTAVLGPQGKTVEVQIRTHDMHRNAELGIAAHWRYKEGAARNHTLDDQIAWLRQILEWKEDTADAGDFLDQFKAEAFHDRVYVFTPKGEIIELPQGATPLDFAYHIHTGLGNRCRGAKINGRIVPLSYQLHNGEQIEILTAKDGAPSRDWLLPHLGYLKTARARAKVRHWFKQQDRDKNIAAGRIALDQEFQRLDLQMRDNHLEKLLQRFNLTKIDELYAAIGGGDLTTSSVASAAQDLVLPPAPAKEIFVPISRKQQTTEGGEVHIRGVGNLLTQMARCCKPVPYDPIVGFITQGRGVTIHRKDCPNLLNLENFHQERFIEVDWGDETESAYAVDIQIEAYDRPGLLRDITSALANDRINVLALNTLTDSKTHTARMALTLAIIDLGQLSRTLDKINHLPNVIEARRKRSGT